MVKSHTQFFVLLALILFLTGCVQERKKNEQLVLEGIRLLQAAKAGEASVVFNEVLKKDPENVDVRLQLARTYSLLGNFTSAEKELEKVRRQNPSLRVLRLETARIMAATGRPDEALRELAPYLQGTTSGDCDALQIAGTAYAVNQVYPVSVTLLVKAVEICGESNSSATLLLAGVLAGSERLEEAERRIKAVIAKEPENKKAVYMLSDVQLSRKDRTAAFKNFDRILKASPGDAEAHYQKGLLYLENGDHDEALAIGRELTKNAPDAAEPYRLLGFAYFLKNQYASSIAALQKSLAIQPNAATFHILGFIYFALNDNEQAMKQCQKALDLQPSFTPARLQLAQLLLSAKRTDQAIKEVKKTLTVEKGNAFAHVVLGSAYLAKKEYAEGIGELNRAVAVDPSLPEAHGKRGLVALKRGMGQKVESELAAVINPRPDPMQIRLLLAVRYMNRNEPQKAIETLLKGNNGDPAEPISCYLIGEAYLRQNKDNEAKTYYIKAKAADPKFDLAYRRQAAIYIKQGKQEQGIRELQNLLDHSPNNVPALLLLASLDEINGTEGESRKRLLKAAGTGKADDVIAAARYFWRTNDRDSGLKILNDAINNSSADPDPALYELKGKILFDEKKYREALEVFAALDRRSPRVGFEYITKTYLAMGESAKALSNVQTHIRRNPASLGLRAELSKIQQQIGNRKEALDTARDIIRKAPESLVGYLTLASIHQTNKEIDKAIDVLKRAPKTQEVKVALFLSSLYASQKRYSSALEECVKVQDAPSGQQLVLFQKAAIFQAMGRKREAEAEYQKLIRIEPNNAMVLNNLACLYIEENRNLHEAFLYATRAFTLLPESDVVRDTLGYVLVKTGRMAQGLKILKNISDNNPKNATFHYHLAIAYKESGKPSKAVASLLNALSIGDFPDARDATMLLHKIKRTTFTAS